MSIRIHLRRLLRSRGFLATAILVLGLGLGFNLILFNTTYALLWRPLQFPEPDRLVTINGRSNSGDLTNAVTGQEAWMLRSETGAVSLIGLTGRRRLVSLLQGDQGIDMPSAAVDSDYFRVLGLAPVAGRLFGAEEDAGASAEQPSVLTESAWRTRFGSDLSVVGRVFVLQEGGKRRQTRVIGVVSGMATLPFASDAEILLPIASASPGVRTNAGDALYRCVVRLQPGMSHRQASTRVDAALQGGSPKSRSGAWGHHWLEPLRAAVAPVRHTTIWLLYGAACLLLLLTCANLASLFVARSIARTHETSVHLALGATPWHVVGANFREALLVCAAGTGLAFLVESWARPLVPGFVPSIRSAGPELLATGPVLLAFGVLACLAVSLLVSAASGLRFRIDGLAGALAQSGRGGGGRGAGRFRALLASGQLAIVLTLLTAACMIGRSFLFAARSDPGLDAQGIVTVQLSLPSLQGAPPVAISNVVAQLATISGVTGVTYSAELPVGSPAFSTVTAVRSGDLKSTDPMIAYRLIGPSYFETLGTRMVSGRTFSQDEVQRSGEAAIVNEAAARLLFPGGTAMGRTLHSGIGNRKSVVVGVVKNIRTEGLDQAAVPMVYLPYFSGWGLRLIIRSGNAPAVLLPLLRDRVRSANAGALLLRYRPLDEILDETVRGRMLSGTLIGGFALLGLVISSIGLYGTLAAQVQERRREIGIRVAMGATVNHVVAIILGDGLRIVVFGALTGLGGSLAAGSALQRELYGVSPRDLTSFAVALGLLSVAALAACLIPAFRAGQVDPIQALNVQ